MYAAGTSTPFILTVCGLGAASRNGPGHAIIPPVARFKTKLFRYPGPGGWTFALIPKKYAPPVTHGWGRTPVLATVDGLSWNTSVWRDRTHGTLLAVPKKVRGDKGDGDFVEVKLEPR